jgi:hypothetical protein
MITPGFSRGGNRPPATDMCEVGADRAGGGGAADRVASDAGVGGEDLLAGSGSALCGLDAVGGLCREPGCEVLGRLDVDAEAHVRV